MNRQLYFLLALIAGTGSALAVDMNIPQMEDVESTKCGNMEAYFSSASPKQLMQMNGKRKAVGVSEAGVTVTLNLIYDETEYVPKTFYIYNEDTFEGGYVTSYAQDGKHIALDNLNPGTYTVMTAFDEMISHPGTPWTKCYVFVEDVNVTEEITIDVVAASATNQFIGKSFLPDGEEARVDNNGYDENLDPLFVPGNCLSKLIQTTIYDTKYNAWIVSAVGNTGTYAMDNIYGPGIHWRPEEMYNIMVNDISDRFLICQQRDNYTEDGIVATVAYSKGISNLALQNDITNYRSIEEFYNHTPAFEEYGSPNEKYQFSCLGYEESSYFPYSILPWSMTTPFSMFFSTSSNAAELPDFHPYYRFQLYDAMVDWTEYYLKGQRFTFDENGAIYSFSNFFAPAEFSGVAALDSDGNEVYYEFPGNPALDVPVNSFLNYAYGNSASINTITPLVYKYEDEFITNLNPYFKGLLGEERQADKIGLEVSVSIDGKEVLSDGSEWNRFWNDTPNDNPSGEYTARMENNTNIVVDEISGYNITSLTFSYDGDDICPPALQALQFRDNDNRFAQSFDTGDDVNILLCAGDYDWNENDDYIFYNYDSKPVSATVYIALHGNDSQQWEQIEMENIEEYNNLAAYGYFFKGSLKDSGIVASPGWYDLKISVTDNAGNCNEQILGPAFYVNKLTSVDNINASDSVLQYQNGEISFADGSEGDFRLYSADGQLRLTTTATSADLSNLDKGVYLVVAKSGSQVIRKKIMK